MSARRVINSRMGRQQGQGGGCSSVHGQHGGNVHYIPLYQDTVTRKREERMIREAHRRDKKMNSYLEEDENYPSFKNQLAKIGLELRDIPGDGNCLFRALGDQFEGHVRNHFRHRQDVVRFMVDNKADFEPFLVDEDTSFEQHLWQLQKMGTYAGNDAIVAFSRLHKLNIIIHQLNSPFLLIQGPDSCSSTTRQLHIAYHNGDHYSSVRRVGDNTESPTNIRLKLGESEKPTGFPEFPGHDDGVVRAVRDTVRLVEEVVTATGCPDRDHVLQCLADCDYDVDATVAYLLQALETMNGLIDDSTSLGSQMTSTDSGIWSEDGSSPPRGTGPTHSRQASLGGSSGYGSHDHPSAARMKGFIQPADKEKVSKMKLTSKQSKKQKKLEKKQRAEEKHKMKVLGLQPRIPDDEDQVITIVTRDLQMARI
ncbi:OTU domain-containing protein 3-like [Dreissena polymorpha]|uniref:OTU domain-containing protein n=1 Tax=Dreissena polymorpha TaxID=45954 RepID=A0A9D4H8M9_DREPO|nr:OTU domain-containing protein 3-like [Dreissena polymorpha]KAH3827282.1 hypothetical protein DPMN_129213 [Dreissena polymorpha]